MIYLIYETLNFCDRVPLDIYASLGKSSLYNKETFPYTFILLIDGGNVSLLLEQIFPS